MGDNEELSLGKDDRLPWLEPVEDYPEESTAGRAKAIVLGVALVAALGLALGGIWYVRSRDQLPDGNGALIAAPKGPYKTRPADAGGMTVDGQGDASFAASEGAETDAKLDLSGQPEAPIAGPRVSGTPIRQPIASGKSATAPVAEGGKLTPQQPSPPGPKPVAEPKPKASTKGVIQLGAYSSQAAAHNAFASLSKRFSGLSGLTHIVIKADVDGKTLYRLRATAGSQATDLCAQLTKSGATCMLVK